MTRAEVLAQLEALRDPRGVEHWNAHAEAPGGLQSFGIGLTKLRKFAKTLGRDAALARELWKSNVYDAKIVALLIDDPKAMTVEQAEAQVDQLQGGYLAHVFSSCDATLAKTPFVVELMERWTVSDDETRRRCGYGLLYELSKSKRKSAPDEASFLAHIDRIEADYEGQPIDVLMAMAGALMGIGMRSKRLHGRALRLARKIGPIDFDPRGKCDPFDVAKNLSKDLVKQRLGL